jgi:hypothetical protein
MVNLTAEFCDLSASLRHHADPISNPHRRDRHTRAPNHRRSKGAFVGTTRITIPFTTQVAIAITSARKVFTMGIAISLAMSGPF